MHHFGFALNSVRLIGLYWLPVIGYAALIFYFSSLIYPGDVMPSFLVAVSDKMLHMLEFGILGILCYRAFRHAAGTWAARYGLLLAIMASVLYGFADELHQAIVPGRTADAWDFLADATGAVFVTWGWQRLIQTIGSKGGSVSGMNP
jgi:VanZ family protein